MARATTRRVQQQRPMTDDDEAVDVATPAERPRASAADAARLTAVAVALPVREAAGAAWHAARSVPGKQMVLYAGLGIAAAASVIEWPVAVAVAAGSEIARRTARGGREARQD